MSVNTGVSTSIPGISASLNTLFDQMRSGGDQLLRTSSKNALILFTDSKFKSEAEELVSILTEVSPARIFLLSPDDKINTPEASVSALCHGLSKLEHICSEIVTLRFNRRDAHRVPFVVRANNISGVPTELYVIGNVRGWESELRALIHISDSVIFDSERFPDQFGFMLSEGALDKKLVDLAWIRLSPWRDEIRSIFDAGEIAPTLEQAVAALSSVELLAECSSDSAGYSSAFLIAGWIISCLSYEVSAFGANTFECQRKDGKILGLKVELKQAAKNNAVRQVTFNFEPKSAVYHRVRVLSQNGLAVYRDSAEQPASLRQIEQDTLMVTLSRFFLVGESVKSYTQAAQSALVLENLMRGYTVGGMS